MSEKKKVFKMEFEERHIQLMKPLDGILALMFCILIFIMMQCFVILFYKTDIYVNLMQQFYDKNLSMFLFSIPFTIVTVLPIFVIVFFRKQELSSIGFKNANILKSIILGVLFSSPVVLLHIQSIYKIIFFIKNENGFIWVLLYYLICISLAEEIIFRSFLSTRIQGIIKNKWLSIWIVGIICALYHIPMQMAVVDMSLGNFILTNIPELIFYIFIHIYLEYIYTWDNNIITPTITHTIFNLLSL